MTLIQIQKRKKIIADFILSILSSLLSIGVLQLLVYPLLSRILDSELYGQLLTMMGVVNTITISLGNTLNNTRLIQNSKYTEEKVIGDFNFLLVCANIIGSIAMAFFGFLLFDFSISTRILIIVMVILVITKAYFIVAYRLLINFKYNLYLSFTACIGYILGVYLVNRTGIWPLTFIIPEIFSLFFLLLTSSLHKEPFKLTHLFKGTATKYIWLISSGLIANSLTYIDRFILYPILKGEGVSTYYTASFFGKSFALVLGPISGVLLSYLSQVGFKITMKKYLGMVNITLFFTAFFSAVAAFIAPWITGILYPDYISSAKPYMLLANSASIIGIADSICATLVLKYAPIHWQLVNQVLYGAVYMILGLILLNAYSLYGFALAVLITNCVRVLVNIIVTGFYIKRDNIPFINNS